MGFDSCRQELGRKDYRATHHPFSTSREQGEAVLPGAITSGPTGEPAQTGECSSIASMAVTLK